MKLLIAGSRTVFDFDFSAYVGEQTSLIISGGACGIDSAAEAYADRRKISKLILRPDYKKYGRRAPLLRNEQMVDLADEVLVIWDTHSRGSRHTIEYAKKCGKPLRVVEVKEKGEETPL